MLPLLTSAQAREVDDQTIRQEKIPSVVLMEHAALSAVERLFARFNRAFPQTRGAIVAGPGNNGADAKIVARILTQKGFSNFKIYSSARFVSIGNPDWIIDGIFGTGLSRPLTGIALKWVEHLNSRNAWILSLDMPSGLCADTGTLLGGGIRASETITFGHLKRGLVTGVAADIVGKLFLAPIQIARTPKCQGTLAYFSDSSDIDLPLRPGAGHKGNYGHVYVWAGTSEKAGASILTALSALRAGCGLVTVVGPSTLSDRAPVDVMFETPEKFFKEKHQPSALVIGPGLGMGELGRNSLVRLLKFDFPLVLDADAINLIAESRELLTLVKKRNRKLTFLTPHPKEAARVLDVTVEKVQSDRYAAVIGLVKATQAAVLLKGAGSVAAVPGEAIVVSATGNSALSKGGTGDVLAGLVASLLAQGVSPEIVLWKAAWIHGRTAEWLSQRWGERSPLASDIAEALRNGLKEPSEDTSAKLSALGIIPIR